MSVEEMRRLLQWYIWHDPNVTDREREIGHAHLGLFVAPHLKTLESSQRTN